MRAGWVQIDGLDRMSLEEVADWHDYLEANEDAEREQHRRNNPKK